MVSPLRTRRPEASDVRSYRDNHGLRLVRTRSALELEGLDDFAATAGSTGNFSASGSISDSADRPRPATIEPGRLQPILCLRVGNAKRTEPLYGGSHIVGGQPRPQYRMETRDLHSDLYSLF